MKAILDTNVLLSAFLTEGICARILKRARHKQFSFILCEAILNETKRILKDKFSLPPTVIDFFLSILSEAANRVYSPEGTLSGVCRDPDDDIILRRAFETEADFLVTGDNDLLVLKKHANTKILSPREFELCFD